MSTRSFPLSIGILPVWFRTWTISSRVTVACKLLATICTLESVSLHLAFLRRIFALVHSIHRARLSVADSHGCEQWLGSNQRFLSDLHRLHQITKSGILGLCPVAIAKPAIDRHLEKGLAILPKCPPSVSLIPWGCFAQTYEAVFHPLARRAF